MIRHDFKCSKCGNVFEVAFSSIADFRRNWPCQTCCGSANQIWLRAPGLAGVEEPSTRGISRSFIAGHDVQTGQYFDTRSERDRYLKKKGLVAMGPEEHRRSRLAMKSEPEPDYSKLPEAMEKAWQETKAGKKGPPVQHLDPSIPLMEAK